MNTQTGFLIKILLFSAGLSFLVKYGGQQLPIEPTNLTALIIVFLPSLVIGLFLGWQYYTK